MFYALSHLHQDIGLAASLSSFKCKLKNDLLYKYFSI